MEVIMSATETAVYEKLRLLRVNGADFSGAMSWQDALGLMSSIDKALPDLLVGGTTGKFKILLKLIEMLQMSLQSCAQGAEECELCRARSTEQDFYRKRLGSNPLGSGDGVGEQGEDDESNEEEDELCHGLRHVPPNLRRAVLVSLWSFLLRTRTDNKTLVRQLFAELHPDSDSEEAEDPEFREMVLKALDVFSIAVDVGHHEDAKRGKHAGEQFRMGSNKAQAQVRPSLLLAQGGGFVEGLKGDKALKNVLKSSRFGTVAEVGMQGQNILADSEEARVHQLSVVEHHIAGTRRRRRRGRPDRTCAEARSERAPPSTARSRRPDTRRPKYAARTRKTRRRAFLRHDRPSARPKSRPRPAPWCAMLRARRRRLASELPPELLSKLALWMLPSREMGFWPVPIRFLLQPTVRRWFV